MLSRRSTGSLRFPSTSAQRPGFPTWALTDWLRDFVEAEAEATQTPPDLAGMLVLAVLSVTSARIVVVRINDGYSEPLNLYIVVALPPANRKSPVFRDCTAPISEFEREQVKSLTPQIAEASTRLAINEVRLAKAQSDAAKADAQNQETLMQQAVELAREIAETRVPKPPRLLAQDATAEKVKSLLHEYVGRIAMMGAEGDLFDTMAGRYGNRGSANFGVYLDAHSGDDIRVDRVGRPTEYVRNPALTLGLTVQPEVIHGLSEKPGFRGLGLLARLLIVIAESLVGRRKSNPPPVPPKVRDTYAQNVHSLLELRPEQASCSEYDPHELRLSPEAERLRLDFADWLEPQLAPTGELGHIADWAGKLAGQVLRIAGNLHLADHAGHPAPWDLQVAGETLERAIAIGHYLIAHARAAFALMGADPVISDARHIQSWILRTGMDSFTRRDLFEATKGRFKEVRRPGTAPGLPDPPRIPPGTPGGFSIGPWPEALNNLRREPPGPIAEFAVFAQSGGEARRRAVRPGFSE